MRISDWSSDVCSSDLQPARADLVFAIVIDVMHFVRGAVPADAEALDRGAVAERDAAPACLFAQEVLEDAAIDLVAGRRQDPAHAQFGGVLDVAASIADWKSVVEGKSGSVRVGLGGRR